MNGYGVFVWSSFVITFLVCGIFYYKTRKTLKKYEKEHLAAHTKLHKQLSKEAISFKNKRKLKGIANIGYRPTFNQKKLILEVNIFNFSGNLYNKNLSIEFIEFIRGEKKFNGVLNLKKQIKIDCKKAGAILSNE